MNRILTCIALLGVTSMAPATTISVVQVHEPVSLHGTDVDDAITDTGEALQATVVERAMALSGAFPETLVEAVKSPHQLRTNNPNYKVEEVNLLVLCKIGIEAELMNDGLEVRLDVAELSIPDEIDLTVRQVLKLAIVAVRKTLEEYQRPQVDPMDVRLRIIGTNEGTDSLRELDSDYSLAGG